MRVICPKCKNSEFSTSENSINRKVDIDLKKGSGKLYRDLNCNVCGTIFLAEISIEITDVDIDFIISDMNN